MTVALRSLSFAIGLATPEDAGFVASTWKKSQRWLGENRKLKHDEFWRLWNARAADVFHDKAARCHVARDNGFIYGYLVCDVMRVHHLYVRSGFRKLGVASALLGRYHGPWVHTCDVKQALVPELERRGWRKVEWA